MDETKKLDMGRGKKIFHEFQVTIELNKILRRYNINLKNLIEEEFIKQIKNKILKYWNNGEKIDKSIQNKSFMEVFDDLYENGIFKYKENFVKKLGNLNNLYRAQRGNHENDYDRMIPKEEFVKNKNPWNPERVAFVYLGYNEKISKYDEKINYIEET